MTPKLQVHHLDSSKILSAEINISRLINIQMLSSGSPVTDIYFILEKNL
jgi:hypothetical protein